jgi:hypothetical protein
VNVARTDSTAGLLHLANWISVYEKRIIILVYEKRIIIFILESYACCVII